MQVRNTPKNECGKEYSGLKNGCPKCNEGGHYHFSDGSCDWEPCERHGGPR